MGDLLNDYETTKTEIQFALIQSFSQFRYSTAHWKNTRPKCASATGSEGTQLATGEDANQEQIDAFNENIAQTFPMTPEMIKQFRAILEAQERAAKERPAPKTDSSSRLISLEPGQQIPELFLSPSLASVVSFFDATGQPWPITQFVTGDSANYQVVKLGDETGHALTMLPLTRVGFTNMIVMLQGSSRPIAINVNVSESVQDTRIDIQLLERGPNSKITTTSQDSQIIEAGDRTLLAALTHDLPNGTIEHRVEGIDARAFEIGSHYYVRSRTPMISPSWDASLLVPEGVKFTKSNQVVCFFSLIKVRLFARGLLSNR